MKRNGTVAKKHRKLVLGELSFFEDELKNLASGSLVCIYVDDPKLDKRLIKIVKSTFPDLQSVKYKPIAKNTTFLKRIVSEKPPAVMLIHNFLYDYSDNESEEKYFAKNIAVLNDTIDSILEKSSLILILPFSQTSVFKKFAPDLIAKVSATFIIESRDLDKYYAGHYFIDHFANTIGYHFLDDRKYVLKLLKDQLLHYQSQNPDLLNTHPGLVFGLLNKIASLYFQMGAYSQSLQYLQKLSNLLKIHRDLQLLPMVLNNIAVIKNALSKFREAATAIEKAQQLAEKNLRGAYHLGKVFLTANQGVVAGSLGQRTIAFVESRRAVRMAESKLGTRSETLLPLLLNYADTCTVRGDFEEALDQYRRSLKIAESHLGIHHPYVSVILQHIGLVYYSQDKPEMAIRYVNRTLEIMEKALGSEHPYLGRLFYNLGTTYLHTKKPDIAQRYFEWALELRNKSIGAGDALIGFIHHGIGKVYRENNDIDSAMMCFQIAHDVLHVHLPKNHPQIEEIMADLTECMKDTEVNE